MKKDTEISSVYGRMCKIKNYLKVLADNLKRRDHFEVVSAHRVKPAYKRIARDRKFCFYCWQVPFNESTCCLVPRDSRSLEM
jgi:hypothetical protein